MPGLDDVGVQRPLDEEAGVAGVLAGRVLEGADELGTDDLALLLGVAHAGEPFEEPVSGLDGDQARLGVDAEGLLDLLGLTLAQQAVVDEDAGQLVADGGVDERRRDRRVDAP